MQSESKPDLETFRGSLSELKREAAKVIAAMQFGGDRRERRELARRMQSCRRRAKVLSQTGRWLLDQAEDASENAELTQAISFLEQLSSLGAGSQT